VGKTACRVDLTGTTALELAKEVVAGVLHAQVVHHVLVGPRCNTSPFG